MTHEEIAREVLEGYQRRQEAVRQRREMEATHREREYRRMKAWRIHRARRKGALA